MTPPNDLIAAARAYWAERAAEERRYVEQYERDNGAHPVGRELADHEGW